MRSHRIRIYKAPSPHVVEVPTRASRELQKYYSDITVCFRKAYMALFKYDEWGTLVEHRKAIALSKKNIDGLLAIGNVREAIAYEVEHGNPRSLTGPICTDLQNMHRRPIRRNSDSKITAADNLKFYGEILDCLPHVIEAIELKAALIIACVFDLDLNTLREKQKSKDMDLALGELGINDQEDKDLVIRRAVSLLESRKPDDGIELIVELSKEKVDAQEVNNNGQDRASGAEVSKADASNDKDERAKPDVKLVRLMDKLLPQGYVKFLTLCEMDMDDTDEVISTFSVLGDFYFIHDYVGLIKEGLEKVDGLSGNGATKSKGASGAKQKKRKRNREKGPRLHRRFRDITAHVKFNRPAYGRVTIVSTNDDLSYPIALPFHDPHPLPLELLQVPKVNSKHFRQASKIVSNYLSDCILAFIANNPSQYTFEARNRIQRELSLEEPEGNDLLTALGLSQKDFIVAWYNWQDQNGDKVPAISNLINNINSYLPNSNINRGELLERLVKLEKLCNDLSDLDDFVRPPSIFISDLTHGDVTQTDKLILQAYAETIKEHFDNYTDFISKLLKHRILREHGIEEKELLLRLRKMSITGNDLYLLKAYRKLSQKRSSEITAVSLVAQARTYEEYNHEYLPKPLERVQDLLKSYPALGILEKGL